MKQLLLSLIEQARDAGLTYREFVHEVQKQYVTRALEANNGNQVKAARELGMHRNSLARNIEQLEIGPTVLIKPVQRVRAITELAQAQ